MAAALPSGRGMEVGGVGRGVAAAEFDLVRVGAGVVVVVVVVEAREEVSDGFSGELAALEEELEVEDELSFGHAFA